MDSFPETGTGPELAPLEKRYRQFLVERRALA
jgi:hypothetical protein